MPHLPGTTQDFWSSFFWTNVFCKEQVRWSSSAAAVAAIAAAAAAAQAADRVAVAAAVAGLLLPGALQPAWAS